MKPVPKPAPKPEPASKPAPAPSREPGKAFIRFQFDGLSYNDLIKLFAQNARKPILGEYNVVGTLTFHDAEPYDYEEAFDTLNTLLAMKGFWLVEGKRYFRVVPVAQIPFEANILPGMAEMAEVRPREVVTVVIPLNFMDASTASKAVVRMVSSWGSISPLTKGKGVIITDSADNIRRITAFLKLLDGETTADRQMEAITLKRASARTVAEIVTKLFGGSRARKWYKNPVTGRYELDPTADTGAPVSATADDRTNTVILMGTSDRLTMAKSMIEQLDGGGEEAGGDLRIFTLKNAKAEDVARVLSNAVGGTTSSSGSTPYSQYSRYSRYPTPRPTSVSGTPVRIVADAATNRLIVSAPADKMATIEKLIKELDIAGTTVGGARIFRLKAADARELVSVLTSTLSVTSRDYRGRTTSSSTVRVSADARTNSVIVAGSAADIQVAETIIEELDKEGQADPREIHIVHLKAGDARQIASALVNVFSRTAATPSASRYSRYGRPSPSSSASSIRVEADTTTNTLLIACAPGDWAAIQKILDELQANMAQLATPVTRRIPLKAAKAEELAETLRQIYGGASSSGRSRYSRYSGRYGGRYGPSGATGQTVPVNIVADRSTNSLIITAAEDDHQAIAELIKAMDVPPEEKVDPIRLVRLENAQATKLAATLQAMLPPTPRGQEPDVFVHADSLTNSLLIRAPEGKRKVIEEMIATLDKETKAQARETRIIALKHTSAGELATMLSQLYPGTTTSQSRSRYYRRSYQPQASEDPDRVIISPAPGDRALVIDAPKQKIEEIAQLVKSLDTEDAPGKVAMRTYNLTNAKAAEVASSLASLFTQQRSRGRMPTGTSEPEPRFEANAATNQLLVAATAAQFVEIDKIIKDVQEATLLASETRTFKLKFVKAADLVEVLRTMLSETPTAPSRSRYGRRYGAPSAPTGGVRVAALEEGNAIVVQGPPDKLALAEKLVTSFDVPDVAANASIQVIKLEKARAESLVETLRNMLPPTPRGQEPEVSIEADKATNSILLRAPEAQRTALREIIASLDKDTTDQTREVRIIALKHASATALMLMFQQLYPDSGAAASPYSRYRGRYGRPTPSGPDDRVVITAAPGDKSIVVEAPKTKIDEIAKLITSLDVEDSPGNLQVRTYQLTNVKAADLASSLARLFTQQTRTSRFRGPSPTAGPKEPEPRFEADPTTNQLLVAATAAQFVEIEKLIEKLQAATTLATQTKTFLLKHAKASEIVGVLETMLAESASASPVRSRYSYRGRRGPTGATGQVRVAAVEATNAVVVQGPPDKLALAETLIKGFDTPEAAGKSIIRLVPLANARAEDLVTKLQAMLPPPMRGQEQAVFIQADPPTNSVLLRAPEGERKMLEEMIASLDKVTPSQVRETQIIPLKHASASALVDALTQLYPSSSAAPSRFSRYGRRTRTITPGGDDTQRVIITAAPGDKALIVDAPKDKIAEIGQMVAKLDTAESPTRVQVRTYDVPSGKAADLAAALGRLFGSGQRGYRGRGAATSAEPEPRFDADPSGKQLLVAATASQFLEIDKVIKDLKVGAEAGIQTKTFVLKVARATEMVDVLQTMLTEAAPSGLSRFRGRRPSQPTGEVRVAAIAANNAIVVQGPADKLLLAEELIKTFDTKDAGTQTIIEIVKLENAQAVSLADAVNATLAARAGASGYSRRRPATPDDEQTVTVTAETNSNSILVRGPASEVPEVVQMIKRLDEQGDSTAVQVRVFKLENSAATELAKSIGGLFRDILRQRSGSRGRAATTPVPFSVTGDERTNTLVVHTTSSNFKIVEQILETLDQAGPLRDVKFFYLINADAYDVSDKLNAMYSDRRGTSMPVIEADELSNVITVVAKEADLKSIEEVIGKLDEPSALDDQPIVRIVPLTQIRASRMADFLRRIYSQMTDAEVIIRDSAPKIAPFDNDANAPLLPSLAPGAPGVGVLFPPSAMPATRPAAATQPATRPAASRPSTRPATAATTQPAAKKRRITIAVDRNSNSLIVLANRQELENIQTFIDRLALSAQDADAEFRIIKIKQADPVSIAQTIDSLFNPKVKVQPQQKQPARRGQRQPQQQPVQLPKPQVVAIPDIRTRSVIVRAKPYDFEVIEQLVKQLDQVSTVISEIRIFTLKNTDAAEVASNITELFALTARTSAAPAAKAPAKGKKPSPQQRRVEWVRQMLELRGADGVTQVDPSTALSITANRNTNSLIVSAPPDVMELVQKLVEELDQASAMTRSVRLYPLKHAEVAATVQALKEIFSGTGASAAARTTRGRTPSTPGARAGIDAPVIITGDEAGRLVIVSAPEEKHELVATVIKEIDTAQSVGEVSVKVYRLEHAEAQSMATALVGALSSTGRSTPGRRGVPSGGGGAGQVRISADRSSNSLVVRASKADHDRITKLIEEMDAPPAAKYPVRTIALKNADAAEVAVTLNGLFGTAGTAGRAGRGRTAPSGAPKGVVIEPDAKARVLLVRADDETFAKIQEVVAKLDVVSAQAPVVKMYAVKNAEVATVVTALQQIFGGTGGASVGRRGRRTVTTGDGPVVIVGDEGARKVIVSASEDKHALIAKTIEEIDASQAEGEVTVVVYRLENADATTVASALAGTLNVTAATRSRRGTPTGGGAGQLRISADRSSNSLVIRASGEDHAKIAKLIIDMDTAPATKYPVRVILLKNADAAQMADMLRTLYNADARGTRGPAGRRGRTSAGGAKGGVVIEADERAGMLLIRADDETFAKLQAIIQQLDVTSAQTGVVKLYAVKNAEIATMVTALQQIFASTTGVAATRRRGRGVVTTGEVPVVILGDEGARKVIVSAAEEKHALIAKTITEIDESQTEVQVTVQVYRLEHAQAQTAATALSAALNAAASAARGRRGVPTGGGTGQLRISADAGSNSLVVRASKEDHDRIGKLIAEMDQPAAAKYPVRTIALKNADADELAATLNTLFGAQAAARARRGRRAAPAGDTGVVIQPDASGRMILVRADDETFAKIQETVAKLDVAGTGKPTPTIVALTHAKATDVAAALQASFTPGRGRRLDPDDEVTIVPEPNSNSLIVTANTVNLEKVKALLATLDTEQAGGAKTEFVVLKNARAGEVANVLSQIAGGSPGAGGARGRMRRPTAASAQGVVVTAETASNAVVLSGPEKDITRLVEMAKKLDEAAGATAVAVVKMYPVKNAEIPTMVTALQQIFGAQGTATRYRGRGSTTGEAPVTILGDEGARKIIVSAPEPKHTLIAKTIQEIDESQSEEAVTVQVYRLEHAEAQSLAGAIGSALNVTAAARGRRGTPTGGGGQLRISADTSSNSLVVRASKEDHEKIGKLIAEMDQPAAAKYPVRTIVLKNADVTEVAATLNSLFGAGATARAQRGRRTAPAGQSGVVIEPDRSARMVLVRADDETFTKIQEVVTKLDVAATGKPAPTVLALTHAKAADVQPALQASFVAPRGQRADPDEQVTIVAEPLTNSLIVTANAVNLEKVKALLAQLDNAQAGGTKTEFVILKNAKAAEMAGVLSNISGTATAGRSRWRRGAATTAQQGVIVAAETSSNAVVISGPEKDVDHLVEMAKKLDEAATAGSAPSILALKHAKATDIATTLQAAFVPARGQRLTPADTVTIVPEPLSNSLIVTASASNLEKVKGLLAELDTELAVGVRTEFMVLKNAKAVELAAVLSQVSGSPAPTARGRRTTTPGAQQGTIVTADAASNAIVISGPEKDVERLLLMAMQLDDAAGATAVPVVKMYPVKNADIPTMVQALQQIFGAAAATGRYRGRSAVGGSVPVTILGDEAARKVIVSAPQEKHTLIAKTIEEMDAAQADETVTVKVYRVENADAASISTALLSALSVSGATARGRGAVASTGQLRITADRSSNSLVVRAAKADHDKITALLAEMDVAPAEKYPVRTIALQHADATAVTQILNSLFGGGAARGARGRRGTTTAGKASVIIEADASAKMVLVRADDETFVKVQEVVAKLDVVSASEAAPTVLALQHAKASDVAAVLQEAFTPARGRRLTPEDSVTIVAEPLSNSLIVTANATNLEKVKTLLAQFDKETAVGAKTEFVILKNARASELATVLSQIARSAAPARGRRTPGAGTSQEVIVAAETSSNALVVTGPEKEVERLVAMAKTLDEAAGATAVPVVKMYPVTNADIPTMVQALQQIFGAGGAAASRYRGRRAVGGDVPVTILGDEAARKVIVSAPQEKHTLIAKTITEMDAVQADETVTVKVYRLENADAASISPALLSALSVSGVTARGRGAVASTGQLRITADRSSNSLVVRAAKADHDKITALLAEMDVAPAEKYPVRTIVLNNADATEVVQILNSLFAGGAAAGRNSRYRRGATTGAKANVIIEADRSARMVLVRADDETFEKIRTVATQLDTAATGLAQQTLIPLQHADAASIATAVSQAFAPQRGQRLEPDELVSVVPETNSNSLIVTANERNLERVKALLEKLDTDTSGARTELLVLKHAKAADLAPILTQVGSRGASAGRYRGRGATAAGLTVSADVASNALVITGPSAKVDEVMKMAVELDKASEASAVPVVKMYPLKNADVQTAAAYLERIVSGDTTAAARGRRVATAGREAPVVIIPDEPGKRLIVSAPADKHETIAKVVKEFDESQTGDPVLVKVYKIENTDASSVATALTAALNATATATGRGRTTPAAGAVTQQVRITADRGSNSLIVRAPTSEHVRVAALIEEIDVSTVSKYPVRMIPLTTADPTAVAAVLNRVFGGAETATRGRRATTTGQEKVLIEADADSRMIVVRADDATFEKIRELATKLDVPAGKATRTLLALKHAKADLVAASLSQAFAPQRGARLDPDDMVSVVADTSTNSIIVTANSVNLEKVKSLLAQLDTETAGVRTELLLLKTANATELAPVLTQIVARGSAARGRRGVTTGTQGVTVSADAGSNALIVSGPSADVDEVMQMALQLDRASEATVSSVQIIALKNGDAYTVAGMVRDLYTQQERAARASRQSIDPLAVTADERANALVVATTKGMYEKVSKWVAEMEQMKPARGTMRLIQLKNVDPTEVEKAIQQLFNTPSSGARGPRGVHGPRGRTRTTRGGSTSSTGGRVQTSVMGQQRAILINASDEDFETIKQLAEALDQAAAAAKLTPKIFVLAKADNARVAAALNSMYRAARGVTPRPEDQVTVTALDQTNAVVVSAAKEKMAEVEHLIEQLDKEEVAPQLQFRIYPLENALPTKVMPALQQMLTQIRKLRPNETIDVQADERTKAIIVTAKGTLFEQIEKIIKALDKPPAHAKVEVLILPLKKADATRLAAVLSDMLTPTTGGAITPEARALQEQIRLLKVRSALKEDIPELDLTKPIKITADPTQSNQQGSNSLVISSTPDNLKAMQAIVEIMDTVPLAEGARVRLVHLTNADATSVMTILKDIFTQGQRLAGKDQTSVSGKAVPESLSGKALVYPLNVSADIRTNTLVLSGIEESLALAELIVKDLDRENGKIVTEVRLFKLKHAGAARVLPMLQAVFGEAAATAQTAGAEGLRTQVTRLRTALKDKLPKESKYAKTHPALAIQADEATNILIVAARSDIMPLIADVIQTLDIPGAGSLNAVRIYPLANADAPAVQTILNALHAGPNASLIRDEDKPTIAVDSRTNALVVSTSDKTFQVIEALLKRLDAKATIEMHEVRLVTLENAEAATLAPVIQQLMDARVQRQSALGVKDAERLRMLIASDPRSNSLIVGGGMEGYQLVKSLAEQLDSAAPALGGTVQLLPLVHANSGTMATTLSNLFNQRYQAARTPDIRRQQPIILPDPRTNSLLVSANADDSKILTGLLKKLDVELIDPAVRIEVIPLKHNDAAAIAPSLQQIFQARLTSMTPTGVTPAPQDRVDITTDALSNSLIVSANKENLKLLGDLLAKVDVEPPMETGVVRIFALENSDAQRVATMLQSLITQGLYKPGATVAAQRSPALAARENVAIVVDTRTNALVVSASKENFAVLEEVIRKIDGSADFGALGDVRLYMLKNANAVQLAPTLQSLFDAKRQAEIDAGGSGRSLTVSIIPDGRTNTLLVAGSRESFAALDVMLKTLDGDQIVPATTFRVFALKNATATAIQPTLDRLFSQRVSRGQTTDPVTVIAEARSNTLIVGASPSDMKLAESLIAQLDESEGKPGAAVTHFTLKKADATQVANTLRALFQAQGAAAGAGAVTIGVDERTNTIVVSAGAADVKRIRELIDRLDKEQLTSVTEIRVFTLQHADATELSTVLTATLTNKPTPLTARSQNRQTLLQFISRTKDGKELIATALQEGVLITPDSRSNSLVVVAPVRNMPLLDSLIHALDSTSPRMAEIRVFALKNADAQQMATVLTELFRLQANQQNAKAVSYTLVTTQPAGGSSATIGSAEQDALNVTVDVRTNSLLIGGTKRYVELAEKVIQELDSSPAQERMTQVYRLRNAQATDIQTAMQSFLDAERQRLTSTLGTNGMGSAHRLLEHEVAVVAEETSNTLLLSASPRYFPTIESMIEELDQPPPQVLIQVLLAEVKLTDNDDFGIDWSLTTRWDRLRKSAIGTTNFGVSGSTEGFSLSLTAGDLRFFLRALQKQNRLEVLSRPQILASDNQEANINVGSRVPFIRDSRVTEQGTTINTIQYEDVGIILNVTPRINPEGFVKLEVNPEISSLSNSTVTISEGVDATIVDSRSAETTVTVQDGHTIILGGLILTKDEEIIKKVPWFGDLPGVGLLFRSTEIVKERSELLIILTPHVMRTIEESDSVTDRQLQRMQELRNFERDQIEDYLKKYMEKFFEQAVPGLDTLPASQPATRPAIRPATRRVGRSSLGRPMTMPWELPKVEPKRPARSLKAQRARTLSWLKAVNGLHAAADNK